MNTKKIILATIIIWIVGAVFSWLICGWLFNWVYAIPPNIWQTPEVMMSPTNMIVSNLLGLVTSVLFVLVFATLYKGIPGQGAKKGMTYGLLVWLVSGLSGMITMPFYMTIATAVVVYWIIQALVLNLIRGAIVGAIYPAPKE